MMHIDLRALLPQHQTFLLELLRDWNATGAYRRAGYRATGHAAEVNASRLLKRPAVAQAYRALHAGANDGEIFCETSQGPRRFRSDP